MLTALNPLMLYGCLAVAVPILIHLLIRQRPQPRPWAAMRWLQAAIKAAQRRYRLTNLLLLLLRCLAVLLLALVLARPSIPGLGGEGPLVILLDTSMSMGPLGDQDREHPLAQARRRLAETLDSGRRVTLFTVGETTALSSSGQAGSVLEDLSRVEADQAIGGLDRAADGEGAALLLAAIRRDTEVLMVSDFRQDSAEKLQGLLADRAGSVRRWRVGEDGPNALISGVESVDDLVPGIAGGGVTLRVEGLVGEASLGIDGKAPLQVNLKPGAAGSGLARLDLPPMTEGDHRLRLQLVDDGLSADDVFEFQVRVRGLVPVVRVETGMSAVGAAVAADAGRLDARVMGPNEMLSKPIPDGGALMLREAPPAAAGDRLATWLQEGGVLWAPLEVIDSIPDIKALINGVTLGGDPVLAGAITSGQDDLDKGFQVAAVESLPPVRFDGEWQILMRAGPLPLVAARAIGGGQLIVEVMDLNGLEDLILAGPFPEWVRREIRQRTLDLQKPLEVEMGALTGLSGELRRDGVVVDVAEDQGLQTDIGLYEFGEGTDPQLVVVTASRQEGALQHRLETTDDTDLAEALPTGGGSEWSLYLAIALLVLLMGEGAFGAWAGRTYGT